MTIAVLGATGVFGSRIAEQLPGARRLHRPDVDVTDASSVRAAVEGCRVVVHAAGPFQGRDHRVAMACIEAGAHYVDIADARRFVVDVSTLDGLAKEAGVAVLSGASSVPALTHAMVAELAPSFASIDTIDLALCPGNRNPRGVATVAAILSYVGRPLDLWEGGSWAKARGWSRARTFDFPPPVGRRRARLCDVPDLEIMPDAFGAKSVRFAAGLESGLLNLALDVCSVMRLPVGEELAPLCTWLAGLLAFVGTPAGAVGAWVTGTGQDGAPARRSLALVTERDGPAVACAPAVLAARRLLDGDVPAGARPCAGLLRFDDLLAHLAPMGVRAVRQ